MSLHDELQRVADRAPVVDVPTDLYARGRRARVWDRMLLLAAAAAAVTLVAGLVAGLPARTRPPVADTDTLGVPDRLWAPERIVGSADLAVGPAAAAWLEHTRVVVVGADGAYHRLEPPGLEDLFLTGGGTALSPDGTRLAYTWADLEGNDAGLRIADLTSGSVTEVQLDADDDVAPMQLAWSAGGRWLAWRGTGVTWQGDGSYSGSDLRAGRVAADDTSSQDVGPVPGDANLSLGITDEGDVLLTSTARLLSVTPSGRERLATGFGRLSGRSVVDPATGTIAYGVGGDGPVDRPGRGVLAVLVDPASGDRQRLTGTADRVETSPLGFVGSDLLLGVTPIGADGAHGDRRLELVGPGHEPRRVVELDDLVPHDLTVATGLMTPERPTVHRAEPAWPAPWWTHLPTLALAGLGAAVLLASVRLASRIVVRRRHR